MGEECKSCGFHNPAGWPACARCGTGFEELGTDDDEVTTANRRARSAASTFPPPSSASPPRPLYGQDHIVSQLGRIIDRAFSNETPTLLAIEGEAGAGKTRLLHVASELAAKLKDDVAIRYGARRPNDDGPHAPFGRLLRERFGVTPSSSPTRVRANIGQVVAKALRSEDMSRLAETAHLVGHVAGVPFPEQLNF